MEKPEPPVLERLNLTRFAPALPLTPRLPRFNRKGPTDFDLRKLHGIVHLPAPWGHNEATEVATAHHGDDAGVAAVVATRTKVGTAMVDGEPKTGTGRRSVDLDVATVALLRR